MFRDDGSQILVNNEEEKRSDVETYIRHPKWVQRPPNSPSPGLSLYELCEGVIRDL